MSYFKLHPFFRYSLYAFYNSLFFYLSGKKRTFLTGKFSKRKNQYVNWNRTISFCCKKYYTPNTVNEISDHVKKSNKVRTVGSGHSFNSFIQCEDTLISLSKMNQVLSLNKERKEIMVQGGMILKDLLWYLNQNDLALPVTGAFSEQTIAGLIATNTHGTGKNNGFLSDSVKEIKIIDGKGNLRVLERGTSLFQATVGGLGLTGIIVEIKIKCVENFSFRYSLSSITRSELYASLNNLVEKHDHVAVNLFGDKNHDLIFLETWDKLTSISNTNYAIREGNSILKSLIWIGLGTISPKHILKYAKYFKPQTITLSANFAFSVLTFPPDLQFEQILPFDSTIAYLKDFEELRRKQNYQPYVYSGLRFTPASSANPVLIPKTLGNRWTWLDPNCHPINASRNIETDLTRLTMKYEGFFHPGKAFDHIDPNYLKKVLGKNLKDFLQCCEEMDPDKKFFPPLAEKLFL